MANDLPTDDLLSVATQGKTAGSRFEMSKSEMKKVDGGYSSWIIKVYGNPYHVYHPSWYNYGYFTIRIKKY